ncbi:MAG: DUF3383 family protein [Peptostreptococcaceae bacterium]|nr:DUF3383 family protein [Peptostreptococcaceae bacterium]
MAQAKVKDFVVNITKLTRAVHQRGFGLILIYDTEHDQPYALYDNIAAVAEAFPVTSKAYKIASRIFGQTPRPQQVAIAGNTTHEETAGTKAVHTLTLQTKMEDGDSFHINGMAFFCVADNPKAEKNQFQAGEITAELTALKPLVEKYEPDFDIAVSGSTMTFTQKIPGDGEAPAVSIKGAGKASVANTIPAVLPKGLVAFLNQTTEKYPDFFFLVSTDNTPDTIERLSGWIDTQEKMYFVTAQNLQAPKLVRSENTVVMYHDDENAYVAEGLASYLTTAKVGGVTAKFKEIKGVKEAKINATQLSNLHKANGFTYIEKMGLLQTTEGKATNGEYIDVVMGAYWIQFKMEEGLAYLAANTPKIGFDNKGIAKMVAVCEHVLRRAAFEQDIILVDSEDNAKFEITYIPRELTDPNDVANRNYTGIKWTAKLAGAIHKATISGILEY